jgi:hypothetical protein
MLLAPGLALPVLADESGNFLLLPFRGAAAAAGTPIAITREVPHNFKLCLHEYKDDNISWKIMGSVSTCIVAPCAAIVKGCIRGPKNAIVQPAFSKDAFSLGDMED